MKNHFKNGMKKYGRRMASSFSSNRKDILEENKLNHAERLAITPVALVVDPLVLIPLGVGAAAVGLLAITTGLAGRILIGKGITLMATGGGLLIGGVAIAGMGVISPVLSIGSIPYNSYEAFKNRERALPAMHTDIDDNKSSSATVTAVLIQKGTDVPNIASNQQELSPPLHTGPLFSENNNSSSQEEIQPSVNNVINL
ncbi:hypothetical protein Lgra_0482 [Legionella gratiana]|uniref:Uncharacterized protein n=1 Tax=Legionella gratiana TaxID=45066 RepID=A0A378JHP4_9GAMM|nr:hypothetical protein [Legionella gratiana]KTD14779.1 hypothetical protein Lgra_0482 [Legionella gratiana]STX44200.1 Uncharacterised protein [Legionella gratiana]